MKAEPILSVIVPVFNVEEYLDECLTSILRCDIQNMEIIIIDDGSTDKSNQIIKGYALLDKRINVVEKENSGPSSARNEGLKRAKGAYILFVDSDDILFPDSLPLILNNSENHQADVIICDYFEFDSSGKKFRYDQAYVPEHILRDHDTVLKKLFYLEINFAVWNKIYKRSFLIEKNLKFRDGIWFEDFEFVFNVFYNSKLILKENTVLIGYRQRKGSIMKSVSPKILDKKKILYEIRDYLDQNGEIKSLNTAFNFLCYKMFISILYQVMVNKGTNTQKAAIVEHVFTDVYFYDNVLKNLRDFKRLRLPERILFYTLKYNILNAKTFKFLDSLV